ncbi:tyrosine-type recombinase/integrase [Bacillus alkalicellulosilyticus]|uniref:tyrosine-type recombinase/integrase n=1 Tax=Alkalihalobacterium alkalicellulosilyticum TaxID=1912214 RepID=UPI0009971986|nr:tyrosine-type recombinase/integrase [Bacillus alkalicellulosilyticus]
MESLQKQLPEDATLFLLSLTKKGRRPSTIKRYHYDLHDYFRWVEAALPHQQSVTTMTTEMLQQFFDFLQNERNYDIKTRKRMGTVIKQFYKYLYECRKIKSNPFIGVVIAGEIDHTLCIEDILSIEEQQKLRSIIRSSKDLTENQLKARPLLIDRNESIIVLLMEYGLCLRDVTSLTLDDVHFESNVIDVHNHSSSSRSITLKESDKKLLYRYYQHIPLPVRPKYHSDDPFFVAFDFQRNTYRWSYEKDRPKELTEIAIQKMLRHEVKRAGLRKGICAMHLRHTFAVNALIRGESAVTVQEHLGLKSEFGVQRYLSLVETLKEII